MIFTEDSGHYIVEPYPDSKTRFDLAVRFSEGEQPGDADLAYLSKFNRPIYVVSYRSEDKPLMTRMQEIYGLPIFRVGTMSVYRLPVKAKP
jgi:hypothetical protein